MTAKLIVTAGPNRGAQFPLTDRIIFNIGSDRSSTVYLDDPKVSPNHCRLYREDTKFTLFDVSGKGIAVNGKKVVKAVLAESDVISIGDSELRFTMAEVAPPAPYTAPPAALPPPAPAAWQPAPAPMAPPFAAHSPMASPAPPPMAPPAAMPAPVGPDFQLQFGQSAPKSYKRVWLQCVEGNDKGKTFDLSEGNVWVIGRGHSADVTVMDIKVSRAHCRIDRVGNAFYLNDLNSTNGTFLNGQQVSRQVLNRGDYIKVGYTILAFQYETADEGLAATGAEPLAPAYAPPPPSYAPAPPPPPYVPPAAPQYAPPVHAPPPEPAAFPPPPPLSPAHSPSDTTRRRKAAGADAEDFADVNDAELQKLLDYAESEGGPNEPAPGTPPAAPLAATAPAPAAPAPAPDEEIPLDMAALDAPEEPPAWGAPVAPPHAAPPRRQAPMRTMDLAVPSEDDLFADELGAGFAAPPAPPAPSPPAPAFSPPPARSGPPKKTVVVGAPPPAAPEAAFDDVDSLVEGIDLRDDLAPYDPATAPAPPVGYPAPQPPPGERKHKTGELPVSGYLVKGGPAPPPVPSERNAPIQCFLCHRPFTTDDIRAGRMRRIKENYYCLACCEGF
jgi:pSer/pThr/pTyr-binding forkhead associated (FHA) protein